MVVKPMRFVTVSLVLFLGGGISSVQALDTDQLIQFYQHRIARDPDDFAPYNQLAATYLQKARETGDPSYYHLAEKALRKSLELVSNQPAAAPALTYLATVSLAKHQFREALQLAQQALALDPGNLSPNAIIGDVCLDLGEYEKALHAYQQLQGQRTPFAFSSRLAYWRFLHGDTHGALQLMHTAIEKAVTERVPAENLAWSHTEQGDLFFHIGEIVKAETAYQSALTAYFQYHRALAGLARVRTAQQRYAEAIELYKQALAVVPFPDYAAALGDLYAKIGSPAEAQKQYTLVEYIGLLSAINQTMYNRELALFYADHDLKLTEALTFAQKELEVRQDIYTYDVLAWVLYKNGKWQEADTAMRKALRLGTKDARLFFHAGMIAYRLERYEEARDYLQQALSLNPHFHIFHAERAERTLKEITTGTGVAAVQEQKND
jgi:tetratricopeptide (TPR) repeat protein